MDNSTATGRPFHNSENIAESHSTASDPDGRDFIGESSGINFYALFESTSDAIFLLDGDKIIDCNKKTLDIFACSRNSIINRSLRRFLPPEQPNDVDSSERLEQKISAALKGEPQFFECKLAQADNNYFDAEINFNCVELKGKRLLHCIVRDVTEHKREEEIYKTLTMNSPVGIYIVRDGRFLFVNPKFQEFVGYSHQELIGMESISLIYPDDRETTREN